jgi:hypothetical protein
MYYIGVFDKYEIVKKAKPSLYAYSEPEYVGNFPERKDLVVESISIVTNPVDKNAKIGGFEKIYDSDPKPGAMCIVKTGDLCIDWDSNSILTGVAPVRSKIEVLPADDPNRKPIGFKVKEKKWSMRNKSNALSKLKVSRKEPSENKNKLYNEDNMICYTILSYKGYTQNLFIKYYDSISVELLSDNPNDFGTLL